MDSTMGDMRRRALEKIATLSASNLPHGKGDLERLSAAYPFSQQKPSANGSAGILTHYRPPMGIRELEVLLALCKAAPLVQAPEHAEKLLSRIAPYLLEAHVQTISASPSLRLLEPSPWECLTQSLAAGVLSLGINHEHLRQKATEAATNYLENCLDTIATFPTPSSSRDGVEQETLAYDDLSTVALITISLLGFLEAAASYANAWTPRERLQLIETVQDALSEEFLVVVETAFSSIRNSKSDDLTTRHWKKYVRHYAAIGRPLGALSLQKGFMALVLASTSLLVADPASLKQKDVLEILLDRKRIRRRIADGEASMQSVENYVTIASQMVALVEDGSDYIQISTTWQQSMSFSVKAYALIAYTNCAVLHESAADRELLLNWLDETMVDPVQMADETLASAVLRCLAVLASLSSSLAANVSRILPRFVVKGEARGNTIKVAAQSLSYTLSFLSKDVLITTLYSLGNVLSSGDVERNLSNGKDHRDRLAEKRTIGSAISVNLIGEEESTVMFANVIHTIVVIASQSKDEKTIALALSMLIQKIGKVNSRVDASIIGESAILAMHAGQADFRAILKSYAKLSHDSIVGQNTTLISAVGRARNHLSTNTRKQSALFSICAFDLLENIISKGDVHEGNNTQQSDIELAAREIGYLLEPLARVMAHIDHSHELREDDDFLSLCRDAWFNIVAHGFTHNSSLGKKYDTELRTMAKFLPPLIADYKADQLESEMDLNTILRRGMNNENTTMQKRSLSALLSMNEADIRGMSYPKLLFLNAAYFLETLRASTGNCSEVLLYFRDPALKGGEAGNCMVAIANEVMNVFLRNAAPGIYEEFALPRIAKQLARLFEACCHRIERVQQVAVSCVDRIIKDVPSALCQRDSLFALLELISLLWASCLESDIDEYSWKSTFSSAKGQVSIEMSDDYALRRRTYHNFQSKAKVWLMRVVNISPLDIKGLIQTYLSEHSEDGMYGHISPGRTFALEIGSAVPSCDQRLSTISMLGDNTANNASDFIAQYTARQEYRYAEPLTEHDPEWLKFMRIADISESDQGHHRDERDDFVSILANLEGRILARKYVAISEIRDILRRAAAVLCRSKKGDSGIVSYLVSIPFHLFTKQSIKLGISLWMGVINENPRLQSRILMEVVQRWEMSVRHRKGLFNPKFIHLDPFFVKMDFAPSDKQTTMKRQQIASSLVAPHFWLVEFLSSHFGAARLSSPHVQWTFHRWVHITMTGLKHATGHPLARETWLHIILLSLHILKHCTVLNGLAIWRTKNLIISSALRWFAFPSRISFGGNRLQVKAEVQLLADVLKALKKVENLELVDRSPQRPLKPKQDLLRVLLENELTRLQVWLYPLEPHRRHFITSSHKGPSDAVLTSIYKTAWAENPSLAVQLVTRFQSPKLATDIRWQLVNFPERALEEPEALTILLGSALPTDLSFQLKYLLFWAPVNPIQAVSYFLPAFKSHPFLVQYAMRSLESHPVNVTFFYVPQIVQTLRYDKLHYVERYIIETAKFSQLFAHQIIWNMKANSFKDEDAQVPDSVKPTLDSVTTALIDSFSIDDRAFYEREFSFFGEVTNISGKLRPYIKKSKAEKKAKIEEELRQIKVDVGVYLPSNPDGSVIGIDRKSGKPLQSHAKAPYMATFRIQKQVQTNNIDATEDLITDVSRGKKPTEQSIEIWQSAIFKVGDDCRQDVLALQMIAAFRNIFQSVGLDVYVFPYRVTATAPGCGVIDVLPNSISRDMLGREAVNGLHEYFTSKYGGEHSIRFQEARTNFIKSMAAYSVISYLLQFKDRHNGNIMIDEAGHILHIDFGFCFDIAPGGIRFERAPFKLTTEMVGLMGGSTESQPYRWFEELCIKVFMASRPYAEKLATLVSCMLDSGLPCFKNETVQHFRERFVLERSERDAADFMRDLIKKSYSSYSTKKYDQFQLLTNGIPY